MNIRTLLVASAAIALLSGAALGENPDDNTLDFIHNAAIGNEFEIEASKLALEKSQNKNVKQFAQKMIDDHGKVGQELRNSLQASYIDTNEAKGKLDDKHQKLMDGLEAVSGDDFNKQYTQVEKDAHEDAVKLFSGYAGSGKNVSLKDFASRNLPALKEHLKHAQELKPESKL